MPPAPPGCRGRPRCRMRPILISRKKERSKDLLHADLLRADLHAREALVGCSRSSGTAHSQCSWDTSGVSDMQHEITITKTQVTLRGGPHSPPLRNHTPWGWGQHGCLRRRGGLRRGEGKNTMKTRMNVRQARRQQQSNTLHGILFEAIKRARRATTTCRTWGRWWGQHGCPRRRRRRRVDARAGDWTSGSSAARARARARARTGVRPADPRGGAGQAAEPSRAGRRTDGRPPGRRPPGANAAGNGSSAAVLLRPRAGRPGPRARRKPGPAGGSVVTSRGRSSGSRPPRVRGSDRQLD